MNTTIKSLLSGLSLAGLLSGCAAVAPAQLVDARNAYAASSNGLTVQLAPTELYDAKKVLDRANKEFDRTGDTKEVRDYAYIAARKIELADVKARTAADRQRIAEAVKQGVVVRDSQVKSGQVALADSRAQLAYERNANAVTTTQLRATNAAQDKELERSADLLETEKQARQTADSKLARAMTDLATIAAVKEEARGLVITLSGSVLFASGTYTLLETAKMKLDQVATALRAQDGDRRMVVEGHTDSVGSDGFNQPLSLNRASAVRDYLIADGVDAAKITAVGLGSTKPLLDNRTAENRANNRRVEIIIRPAPMTSRD